MDVLKWGFQVLCKATRYQNLSGAALHIGLSQPQLSRIVKQLESELGVVLLDRTAKNKACWTPDAMRLAESLTLFEGRMHSELDRVIHGGVPDTLRLGTLEGLIPLSCDIGRTLLNVPGVHNLNIDVLDLSLLEDAFLKGRLDAIVTCREPAKKKYSYSRTIGVQDFEYFKDESFDVFSEHEFESKKRIKSKKNAKTLVSNSLEVRKVWLNKMGGTGKIPGPLRLTQKRRKDTTDVMIIGSENLSLTLWTQLNSWNPG